MTTTPDKLLTAALTLIARHGFDGFSMKDLAGEAGVAAGTAYRHFTDREALLEAAYLHVLTGVASCLFVADERDLDFAQYQRWWRRLWRHCEANPSHVLSQFQFELLPRQRSEALLLAKAALFAPITDFFDRGRARGYWVDLPNDVLGLLTFETLGHLALRQARGEHLSAAVIDQTCLSTFTAISAGPFLENP
ncbi:TetR/AcrR family transcriptional regulator [Litorivicinus lipolyticus]|uniref:TetR/AcrR family transcriptional regulator n=1 Tax=Litorivicinus lipolyticus TaxID=418701 RepID=UPI003B5A6E76